MDGGVLNRHLANRRKAWPNPGLHAVSAHFCFVNEVAEALHACSGSKRGMILWMSANIDLRWSVGTLTIYGAARAGPSLSKRKVQRDSISTPAEIGRRFLV